MRRQLCVRLHVNTTGGRGCLQLFPMETFVLCDQTRNLVNQRACDKRRGASSFTAGKHDDRLFKLTVITSHALSSLYRKSLDAREVNE